MYSTCIYKIGTAHPYPYSTGVNREDNGPSHFCGTSIYMGTSSQAPFDETDSLILNSELYLHEEEDGSAAGSLQLEPDGIKMRSHKDGKFEIQGFTSDPNSARSAEDLEVLHLEPACEAWKAHDLLQAKTIDSIQ